jgi:flagellar motor switch protein FliG
MGRKTKAAIVMMILGPEASGNVLRHLDEEHIEMISLEMARLDKISPDTRQQVIDEFYEVAVAQEFISEGGVDHARDVLISAFGPEKAEEILSRVEQAMQVVPFEFLKRADPAQVLTFIQDEHPQTVALILAYMPVNSAAQILSKLSPDVRADVASRIGQMDQTPPEVIRRVEQVLERKVSTILNQEMAKAGGPKALVELLQRTDRATEHMILENLTETNPELAEQVKNMMFVFEDIATLDDKTIQQILREIDGKDLATALKSVSGDVQQKIFKNMSERAMDMLKEDMEFMGPVRMRVVEESQQKIVAVVRRLEEAGEIVISGRDEEDAFV